MTLSECYQVLGLSPSCSDREIRDAYLLHVKVWHPDRFVSDPNLQRRAQEQLKRVNQAYETLRSFRTTYEVTAERVPGPPYAPKKGKSTPEPPLTTSREVKTGAIIGLGVLILVFAMAVLTVLDGGRRAPESGQSLSTWAYQGNTKSGEGTTQTGTAPASNNPVKVVTLRDIEATVPAKTISAADFQKLEPIEIEENRRQNGEEVEFVELSDAGEGELSVDNGTSYDAVVKLTEPTTNTTVKHVYVRSHSRVKITGIRDCRCRLKYSLGKLWNQEKLKFDWKHRFGVFENALNFRTVQTENGYSVATFSVTLHKLRSGNARTREISEAEFEASY